MAAPRRLIVVGLVILVLYSCATLAQEETEEAPVTKGFSAEVGKMMQIIVHSLYQNPDIFVREMISNAADALTKQRQLDIQNGVLEPPVPYEIRIIPDKEKRTFTIKDSGVGMAKDELITNLGSMGSSGTKRFLENVAQGQSSQSLIGQFGVGFYSVFLVAENVKVASKSDNSTGQFVFDTSTELEYTIYTDPRDEKFARGTEIIIELRPDVEEYAESDKIKKIIDKYSEFVDFPIYVEVCNTTTLKRPKAKPEGEEAEKSEEEKSEEEKAEGEKAEGEEGEKKEGEEGEEAEVKPKKNIFESDEEEYEETTCEWEHVNEVKPIWLRETSENTDEDYIRFYRAIEKDLPDEHKHDPLWWAHFGTSAGSDVVFKSILYIPSKAPPNLFDAAQPLMTNVRLYVRRVFITDEFKDLLPRYLNFIKGVVDSDDLPLNVSREVLQENRLLKVVRRRLTRKVLEMFQELIDKDTTEKERRDALSQEERDAEDQQRKEEFQKKKETKEAAEAEAEGDKKKKKKKKDEDEEEDESHKPLYERFWNEFGKSIRMGVIEDSANRARLTKLLRYPTSASNGSLVGLAEYKERMVEGQKGIFYLSGDSIEKIKESPLLERALSEDVEVLFMTDPIDEYVVQHITEFENNKLMDLAKAVKLRDESSREKKVDKARKEAWGLFLRWVKDTLGGKVEKVELSKRLTVTPCVVVAPEYGVTGRQASIMRAQTMSEGGPGLHTRRILELNPRHSIVDELRRRWKENPMDAVATDIVELLFDVASVQSGFEIEHMQEFSKRMYRMQKHDLNIGSMPDIIEEEAYAIDEDLLADDEEEEDEEPYDPEEEAREAAEEAKGEAQPEAAAEAKPEEKASGHDEL